MTVTHDRQCLRTNPLKCLQKFRDFLDGNHVVFGKVVEGMPVVMRMNDVEIVGKDRSVNTY